MEKEKIPINPRCNKYGIFMKKGVDMIDIKKLAKIKLLDCTIRDGGYLNNWKFEKKVVREVYRASSSTGVDIFEIGFKSSKKKVK